MRFIITIIGGTIAVLAMSALSFVEAPSTKEVPQGTNLFGEINFETNPLTIPWKK